MCTWNPSAGSGENPGLPSGLNQRGGQRALGGRAWTSWARAPSAGMGLMMGKGAWGIWNPFLCSGLPAPAPLSSAFLLVNCWPASILLPAAPVRLLSLATVSRACTQAAGGGREVAPCLGYGCLGQHKHRIVKPAAPGFLFQRSPSPMAAP